MPTSFHEQCRVAVKEAIEARFAEEVPAITLRVYEMEVFKRKNIDLPCVVVSYAGTEYEVGGTNVHDDMAFPLLVGLYTVQPSEDPPGMELTYFRQVMRLLFNNKRLAGVPLVYQVGYDGNGPQYLEGSENAFQDLRGSCFVAPVARLLRS